MRQGSVRTKNDDMSGQCGAAAKQRGNEATRQPALWGKGRGGGAPKRAEGAALKSTGRTLTLFRTEVKGFPPRDGQRRQQHNTSTRHEMRELFTRGASPSASSSLALAMGAGGGEGGGDQRPRL